MRSQDHEEKPGRITEKDSIKWKKLFSQKPCEQSISRRRMMNSELLLKSELRIDNIFSNVKFIGDLKKKNIYVMIRKKNSGYINSYQRLIFSFLVAF